MNIELKPTWGSAIEKHGRHHSCYQWLTTPMAFAANKKTQEIKFEWFGFCWLILDKDQRGDEVLVGK